MGANSFFLDKHARIEEGKQEENFLLVEVVAYARTYLLHELDGEHGLLAGSVQSLL
jgi:hypothetical protein